MKRIGFSIKRVFFLIFFLSFEILGIAPVFAVPDEEAFDDAFDPVLGQTDTPTVAAAQDIVTKLTGIGIGGDKSFAVINGEVYKVGEFKNGIRVTKIRKKEADIIVNGVPRHLKLNKVATRPGEETTVETSETISEMNLAEEDMNFDDEPAEAIQTHEISTTNEEAATPPSAAKQSGIPKS